MAIKKFNSVAGFSVGEQDYVIDVVDDQANITANNLTVGNITSLGDVGNVKITGGSANYVLKTDGSGNLSWATAKAGGGSPGDTYVQFNDGGEFAGVADFTFDKTAKLLTVTGNITTGNLSGGNLITANYASFSSNLISGNANLGNLATANYVTISSNLISGNANLGNLASANFIDISANLTSGNASLGNLATATYVTVSANLISGNANLGNVASANFINISSNLTSGNANLGNLLTANYVTVAANLISGNATLGNLASANFVTVSSNITAGNINAGNVLVANYISGTLDSLSNNQSNITNVGTLLGLSVYGNTYMNGNLHVSGNISYINTVITFVVDPIVEQGGAANNASALSTDDGKDRGTLLHYYDENITAPVDAFMGWKNASDEFIFASNVSVSNDIVTVNEYGNVHANYFIGKLSGTGDLTSLDVSGNITAGNIIGPLANGNSNVNIPVANGNINFSVYGNANVAIITSTGANVNGYANISGLVSAGNLTTVGNITAGNASLGNLATANYFTGTLTTASQPNITTVGTLTNLDVAGNLTVGGTFTYVNATVSSITDPLIDLGNGSNNAGLTSNDGMDRGAVLHYYVGSPGTGTAVDAFMGWDNSNSEFVFASNVTVVDNVITFNEIGNVRANTLTTIGNLTIGGTLNVTGGISGSVGNAIPLGYPTDANLITPGALDIWTTTTTVTDAIDDLNEVMLNVVKGTFVGNVDFTASVVAGPSPLTLTFSRTFNGTGTNYLWDFGDGTTSTSSTPSKTYTNLSGGQFTVTLTVSNSSGSGAGASDSKIKTDYITLYTPTPIPSFTLSKTALDTGTSLSVTNTSQYAQSYVIHWGDGTSDAIASNGVPGGVGGGAKTHTYTITGSADTRYQPYIIATSTTAGPSPVSVTSSTQNVYVYKTHSPTFTYTTLEGNNDYTLTPDGWNVTFTNTTPAGVGATSTFSGNYYKWTWGDGTTTSVNAGSGSAGDRSVNITHKFSLTNPAVNQNFTVNLEVYNGHSTSPFSSITVTVTVHPDPQSIFTGTAVTTSDRTGDSVQKGYLFTDLNGLNRAIFRFTNTSLNTDTYKWTWGDTTDSGIITSGSGTPSATIDYTYTATGTYTVSLLATGTYSESASDDTNTKASYITVASAPAAPSGLSTVTLTMSTASAGTTPYLAASATDNSGGGIPLAGTLVTRYVTGTVVTSTVSDIYNSYTGTLSALFNGSTDGSKTFTSGSDTGTYGNLVITVDRDAHLVSASTYPSDFYKVFSGYYTTALSGVTVGFNNIKLSHTTTGDSSTVGFVKDDVTLTPTVDVSIATLTEGTPGTYRYISGIPYYNTGSPLLTLTTAKIYNWIGQTYLGPYNTATPFTIEANLNYESTTGAVISSQTKTYAQLNTSAPSNFLTGNNPNSDTGKDSGSPATVGPQSISISASSVLSVQDIRVKATNVNGTGSTSVISKKIQVFTATPTGFVETSITYGATTAKRIVISGATGANPTYNSATNYYSSFPWTGVQTIAGTDEAIVRWNQLKWFNTDLSTGYLPVGPDLNTGRTSGYQYFRGAFSKTLVQNFSVTITGKISGLFFAAPGTTIDAASGLNGWIDASVTYAGGGAPGSNTGAGGNGGNGCAKTNADKVPLGSVISGTTYNMTLGSISTSNSTGNQVLFSIVLASGDYVSSWSFS